MPAVIERFLVICVARIGDTLLTTPAMHAVAMARPGCIIDFYGHPKRAGIVENLSFIRRVGRMTKRTANLQGWLGGKRYDTALVFGFDEALVAYALRVAHRVVAFRQSDARLNARLYRVVEPSAFQSEHSVLQLLRLPASLDIAPAGKRLHYTVSRNETLWAEGVLQRDTPVGCSPRISLQVASFPTKAYRDWPIGHFFELCDRIRRDWPHAHFLIPGGTAERDRVTALQRHLGASATLYAGRLSLRQSVALMSRSDLYIGVDTGPTHLIGSLDIPLVGLYHARSPSHLIGPLDHPCAWPIDHPALGTARAANAQMAEISVDRVAQVVARALSDHPPREARIDP